MQEDAIRRGLPLLDERTATERWLHEGAEAPDLATEGLPALLRCHKSAAAEQQTYRGLHKHRGRVVLRWLHPNDRHGDAGGREERHVRRSQANARTMERIGA
jgi:hypothetical protein